MQFNSVYVLDRRCNIVKYLISFVWVGSFFSQYAVSSNKGLPLYYWQAPGFVNFGDYLSFKLVERIVEEPIRICPERLIRRQRKILAIGSILKRAYDNDIIWGSGINGNDLEKQKYRFQTLDIRAVRGPLTRAFLKDNFGMNAPEIYGDPALLLPYFFPEFKRKENPTRKYCTVVHYSERHLFPKLPDGFVIHATDPWNEIIEKILDSELVIATSLHGVIVAEAFGVPARLLRVTNNEPLFKFADYYLGTNRPHFQFATSVEEALWMGGESPFICDLKRLYDAFPFELWPQIKKKNLD